MTRNCIASGKEDEIALGNCGPESTVENEWLMEEVVSKDNILQAVKRVESNKGSAGIDGMKTVELRPYLREHWSTIREQLLSGTYKPQAVRRVLIPKANGGVRKLGVPTVLDRFVQQAVMQVLQKRWDKTFSDKSYGFRPGKSAHQAVRKAQDYMLEGYRVVVDIDLEAFFDRVNHDVLMGKVRQRLRDKRVISFIQSCLKAGVMEGGLVKVMRAGTPQGGPLSPLLSNLLLDELDRELEKRGHRFVRYADDGNIYVRSVFAGNRVMRSVTKFLEKKLRLRVNTKKSAVDRPWKRSFLGFSFTSRKNAGRKVAPHSVKRFKDKIRKLTSRTRGVNVEQVVLDLKRYIQGWGHYFGFCEARDVLRKLDSWVRRKLRCYIWKQWGRAGYRELRKRGVRQQTAWSTSKAPHGPWRLSRTPALNQALSGKYFDSLGLPRLTAIIST
jgi:RNA-directed DNA polymerase